METDDREITERLARAKQGMQRLERGPAREERGDGGGGLRHAGDARRGGAGATRGAGPTAGGNDGAELGRAVGGGERGEEQMPGERLKTEMIISSARPSSRCKDNFREELAAGNGDINYVRCGYRGDEKRMHETGSAERTAASAPA